ncbi:MAG: radical SAM protein [Candidatus Hodarchaeales archaeon]
MSQLHFFVPGFISYQTYQFSSHKKHFPAISITGANCSLSCAHCGGKKLTSMIPAKSAGELYQIAKELSKAKGSEGFLISGGCLPDGSIDFQTVLPAIKQIEKDFGLKIFVHTGLISKSVAKQLKEAGIEAALIDIIGSRETIKEVYGLDAKPNDYLQSLNNLEEEGIPIIPHVVIGLQGGELKGEFEALEIISQCSVSALVLVVFTPLVGTNYESKHPPSIESVTEVIKKAKSLELAPIVLGCVRPFGQLRREIERIAIDLGVNGIAFPTQETIDYALRIGKKISWHRSCCAEIYQLFDESR